MSQNKDITEEFKKLSSDLAALQKKALGQALQAIEGLDENKKNFFNIAIEKAKNGTLDLNSFIEQAKNLV